MCGIVVGFSVSQDCGKPEHGWDCDGLNRNNVRWAGGELAELVQVQKQEKGNESEKKFPMIVKLIFLSGTDHLLPRIWETKNLSTDAASNNYKSSYHLHS